MDQPGHLLTHMHIVSHSNINLCPVLYLKAYLYLIEPSMKRLGGSHVSSLYFSNKRQHIPVCAKTVSSWVRSCGICSSGSCSSLVSILQVGNLTWLSTPARPYCARYISTTDLHQDPV